MRLLSLIVSLLLMLGISANAFADIRQTINFFEKKLVEYEIQKANIEEEIRKGKATKDCFNYSPFALFLSGNQIRMLEQMKKTTTCEKVSLMEVKNNIESTKEILAAYSSEKGQKAIEVEQTFLNKPEDKAWEEQESECLAAKEKYELNKVVRVECYRYNRLHNAIDEGDLEEVKYWLAQGVELKDSLVFMPLHKERFDIAEALFNAGIDINKKGALGTRLDEALRARERCIWSGCEKSDRLIDFLKRNGAKTSEELKQLGELDSGSSPE